MTKTIVAIKPGNSSPGASGVTRYIAESKRDPEKEQLNDGEARPLFSDFDDNLNYHQADQILGEAVGSQAQRDEVIHLVISLEPEQFEGLGDDLPERKDALREIIRETAKEIHNEVGTEALHWIAGIHLNTDNPHVHIAISREALDRESRLPKRIDHLPRILLPHNERTAEEKEFKPGLIADTVAYHLELTREAVRQHSQKTDEPSHPDHSDQEKELETPLHTEPEKATVHSPAIPEASYTPDHALENETSARSPAQPDERPFEDSRPVEPLDPPSDSGRTQPPATSDRQRPDRPDRVQHDREIMGQSMIARGEVERLEGELESLITHGDKRRFRVFDATHGRTRQISQFDVHRRADARAAAAVREQSIVDPDQRHVARQTHYRANVDDHHKAINDHQIIVKKTIQKTQKSLREASTQHALLRAEVRAIQHHYQSRHRPLPVPLLLRTQLGKLQDQAIASGNPSRLQTLENIRQSLAAEHGESTRTDKEIARLEGQLLVSRAEHAARLHRSRQFEDNKHQTRWEIAGEKYSLADIDRRISENENRSRIFGLPMRLSSINILPSGRRAAAAAVEQLKALREVVLNKIEERTEELASSLSQSVKMTQALTEMHAREQENQLTRGGERLEKNLTRSEITRLVEHALTLSDRSMLQQALILESLYNDRQSLEQKASPIEQTAKAAGRVVLTEIALNQAREKLASFTERRDFVPVLVKDLQGNELVARPFDFREPFHPLKWLAYRLLESRETRYLRNEVNKAVDFQHEQLQQDFSHTQQCHQLTAATAARFREELRLAGHQPPEPAFTTKQIMQLEIYALRQSDPNERERINSLINQAELTHHVFTPQAFDNEKAVAKALERNDGHDLLGHPNDVLDHTQHSATAGAPHTPHTFDRRDPAAKSDQPAATLEDTHDLDITH